MGRSSTCPECGTPLVSGGLVCPRCGVAVVSTKADPYRLLMGRMDGIDKRVTEIEERLVKEEMGKLRDGEGGMMEEVCVICGRTFEAVKGGIALTCSEACSQKWYGGLSEYLLELAEKRDKMWRKLWSSIGEGLRRGPTAFRHATS